MRGPLSPFDRIHRFIKPPVATAAFQCGIHTHTQPHSDTTLMCRATANLSPTLRARLKWASGDLKKRNSLKNSAAVSHKHIFVSLNLDLASF